MTSPTSKAHTPATQGLRLEMEPYPHLRDDSGAVLARDYVNTEKVRFLLSQAENAPKLAKAYATACDIQNELRARNAELEAALREAESLIDGWETHTDYRAEPYLQTALKVIRSALNLNKGPKP